jgi:hypothetical protein
MARQASLKHEFVELIPAELAPGTLYISRKYNTAVHLCCCGCGLEVVTPLNPAKWRLSEHGKTVSLFPSIGNWSFPCRSHYWIERGRVRWSYQMAKRQVATVRMHDQIAAEQYANTPDGSTEAKLRERPSLVRGIWSSLLSWFK